MITDTLTKSKVIGDKRVKSKHVQSLFDIDLLPTTLTYIAGLAKVEVNHNAKDESRTSTGWASWRVVTHGQTDGQTDGRTDWR